MPSTWQQGYVDVRKIAHGRRLCCRRDVATLVVGARSTCVIGRYKSTRGVVVAEASPSSRGPDGMPSQPALIVSRVESHRSRQLISDSRALIASAKALIAESRQSIARQRYLRIVCAWCQETIRFERAEKSGRGQVSHSICFDCFVPVFQELAPATAPPPLPA